MSIVENRNTFSPEDLLALPDSQTCELVDGELVEKKMSVLSSFVEGTVLVKLTIHASSNDFGKVFPGTTGFRCFPWDPNMVRKPDVSLIRQDRITDALWDQGFSSIAPDLAVEVVSPNDTADEVEEKVEEYLRAGIPLVWVIYPEHWIVAVHRKNGSTTRLRANDVLSGEDVVPGFACPVSDLFPAAVSTNNS